MQRREFGYLYKSSPEQIHKWLELVFSGNISPPKEYNWWLSLVDHAAFQARLAPNIDNSIRLQWANVAILLYEYLLKISKNNEVLFSERKQMVFRVSMIVKFGSSPDHPALDPHYIEDWFFNCLDISVEDVYEMLDHLSDYSEKDKEKLETIFNRLDIMEFLISEGIATRRDDLKQWLDLRTLYESKAH